MLDLVWKDLVAARRVLLLAVPLFVFQTATFAGFGPALLLSTFLFTALFAFGSIALEEIQGMEPLWGSLPLRRGQIVGARYLTTVLGCVMGLAMSWAVGQAATRLVFRAAAEASPFVGVAAHLALLAQLLFAAAFFLPFCFRFGAGRGALLFSAWAMGALVALSVGGQALLYLAGRANPLLDPAFWTDKGMLPEPGTLQWLDRGWRWILGGWVLLAAGAIAVSAKLSQRLYERRDL